ncbi:shikimate kinase [Pseudomonas trivialis]|nr:shikimate kinase [Pseudomonas trivialis]
MNTAKEGISRSGAFNQFFHRALIFQSSALAATHHVSGLDMTYCTNSQEVVNAIRTMSTTRIGIDGIDGAGKSTLAREVSEALGLPCISLDSFVEKDMKGYVEHIDYLKLKATLEKFEGYVVEGVCLRQVLRRIQLAPAVNNIKRVQHGVWSDEANLDISEPVDVVLARERELASLFSISLVSNLGLAEEVIRYHAEFRPHNHADVTYVAAH